MRYRILGTLELRDGDQWVSVQPTKWRTLLAVLLCGANEVLSTDRLVEELWGERPPQSANKLLQGYVSRLRRALGDESGRLLVTHTHGYQAHGYQLVVRPGELDTHTFERLIEDGQRALDRGDVEGAATRLGEALSLWRGAPFADVPPTSAVEAERVRLESRRLQAQEARIDAELRCGRHDVVFGELETLTAEHPFREGLRGQLMVALYRAGRQADALAAYRDLRLLLVEELGVEPSPPLQQLQQQILAADAALLDATPPDAGRPAGAAATAADVPRQLPHDSATFTGRVDELAAMRTLLDDSGAEPVVISAIDGIGGVGKSALAVRVAHQVADRFPDGQLYVDLCGSTPGLSPLEPSEVLGRFLRALGVDGTAVPADTHEASALFRSLTAERRILVVLDNAAAVAQVRPLLPAGPGCATLVTSRETLAALDGAAHLPLGVLPHDQAVALLGRLAGAERMAAEPDAAAAIVQLCGGLPLALRIVGARLAARPSWPVHAVATRLSDARTRLDELQFGDLAVRASFLASYEGLRDSPRSADQDAARAFRFLSELPGSDVSLPVAAALLDLPTRRAEDALERLVDAHLVHSPSPARHGMHDLLRLFARERADAEEPEAERQAALERVLRCYLATAQEAVTLLDPLRQWPKRSVPASSVPLGDRAGAEAWLEAERANLVAAVAGAAARPEPVARLGVWLAHALFWFLLPRGYVQDLQTVNEIAIVTARRLGDRESEAWALNNLIWVHRSYDEGIASGEAALAIWRDLGDRDAEQRALCNIAFAMIDAGRSADAVPRLERQLVMAREVGNQVAEIVGLVNLGRAYRELGCTQDALVHLDECLTLASRLGDARNTGFARHDLGLVHLDREEYDEARVHLDAALTALDEARVPSGKPPVLVALSLACRRLGDLEAALDYCEQGLALSRELGDRHTEAEALRERDVVLDAIAAAV